MSPPILLVNNLFKKKNESPYIDTISKIFIFSEVIVGLNRLPLICGIKYVFIILGSIYTLLLYIFLFLVYYFEDNSSSIDETVMHSIQYLFCTLFSLFSWRRMQLYFAELEGFDKVAGCKPKVTGVALKNIIIVPIIVLFIVQWYIVPYIMDMFDRPSLHMLPVNISYVAEIHFYSHLLNLLSPRVRYINNCVEGSWYHDDVLTNIKAKEYVYFENSNRREEIKMCKLMDLYHTIIKAYDFLIDAIKWQLLIILLTSFITNLRFSYHISIGVIRNYDSVIDTVSDIALMVVKIVSLFAPCLLGDRLHGEVKRLRELLASKLYEHQLDKSSRSTARALLALTEARDLSFSLLRIFHVDISLPFKFVGLLITYLIILLQFERVINP